jgi:hypothetical protein
MLVFPTHLVNQRPSNLLIGPPTPSLPFPVLICTGVCIYTVCNRGGEGIGLCGEHIQEFIYCVFDQIPNIQNCFTTPNKNLGGEGASDR